MSLIKIGDYLTLSPELPFQTTRELVAYKLIDLEYKESYIRISGTAFYSRKDQKVFLKLRIAAKKKDHILLGEQLKLFSFDAKGCYWLPKGVQLLESVRIWWKEHLLNKEERIVSTPEGRVSHLHLYQKKVRSQKELPISFAEIGELCYPERENSNLLSSQLEHCDELTTFCTVSQLINECSFIVEMIKKSITSFQFDYRWVVVPKKSKNKEWKQYEKTLTQLVSDSEVEYREELQGPLLELRVENALGEEWVLSYLGVNLYYPKKLKLYYRDKREEERPVLMVESSVIGSLERFI